MTGAPRLRLPFPARAATHVPFITTAEMRHLETVAEQEFGISPLQLMEGAGQQVAGFIRAWLGGVRGQPVAVLSGPGNNGADGLVAARYLHNWGAEVRAWLAVPEARLHPLAQRQATAARAAGVSVQVWSPAATEGVAVVLDALLGTGVTRAAVGPIAEAIAGVRGDALCVALDVPSGLDSDGRSFEPAVAPAATITLGLPKPILRTHGGQIFVADIGLPRALAARIGKDWHDLFAESSIVRLHIGKPVSANNTRS
jgi:NAD(P)H-hydrate epimerase